MVLVTIAEATMNNWTPPEASDKAASSEGVYLEILPEPTRGCRCFGCSFRKSGRCMAKNHPQANVKRRTAPVDEQHSMTWRQYNADNFLIPLITLGGQGWSRRKGDTLKILANVYRKGTTEYDDDDELLCTLVGSFRVGTWGPAILRLKGYEHEPIDLPGVLPRSSTSSLPASDSSRRPTPPRLTISNLMSPRLKQKTEPRPASEKKSEHTSDSESSKASTQWPRQKSEPSNSAESENDQVATDKTENTRVSAELAVTLSQHYSASGTASQDWSKEGTTSSSQSTLSSGSSESQYEAPRRPYLILELQPMTSRPLSLELSSPQNHVDTWDVPAQTFKQSKTTFAAIATMSHTVSATTSERRVGPGMTKRSPTQMSLSQSLSSMASWWARSGVGPTYSSTPTDNDFKVVHQSQHPRNVVVDTSHASGNSRFSTSSKKQRKLLSSRSSVSDRGLRDKRLSKFLSRKHDQDGYAVCTDWSPRNWDKDVWQQFWPTSGEDLNNRFKIVPLMETEFRRDCVVFFNTIFPMVLGGQFTTFKDCALDPQSKLQFKNASRNLQLQGFGSFKESPTLSSLSTTAPNNEMIPITSLTREVFTTLIEGGWSNIERKILDTASAFLIKSPAISSKKLESKQGFDLQLTPQSPTRSSSDNSDDNEDVFESDWERYSSGSLGGFENNIKQPPRSLRLRLMHSLSGSSLRRRSERTSGRAGSRSGTPKELVVAIEQDDKLLMEDDILPSSSIELRIGAPSIVGDASFPTQSPVSTRMPSLSISTCNYSAKSHQLGAGDAEILDDVDIQIPDEVDSTWVDRAALYGLATASPDSRASADSLEPEPVPTFEAESMDIQESYDEIIPKEAASWADDLQGVDSPAVRRLNFDRDKGEGVNSVMTLDLEKEPSYLRQMGSVALASTRPMEQAVGLPWRSRHSGDSLESRSSRNSDSRRSVRSGRLSQFLGKSEKEEDSPTFKGFQMYSGLKVIATPRGLFMDEHSPRIMLLKRLFVCFACCGVYYTEVVNSAHLGDLWPYPLAAVLGHGSRVLIRLEDVDGVEFMNFLLFGDPHTVDWKESGVPLPLRSRIAATHSVQLDTETGHIMEKTYRPGNAMETMQNFSDGLRKKHLGLDLPLGGVGNPSPLGQGAYTIFAGRVATKSKAGTKRELANSTGFTKFIHKLKQTRTFDLTNSNPFSINSIPESEGSFAEQPSARMAHAVSTASSIGLLTREDEWTPVPKIQNGHMYIRIDDFGQQRSQWNNIQETSIGRERKQIMQDVHHKLSKDEVEKVQAILRLKVSTHRSQAGEIFFSNKVPILRNVKARKQHDGREHDVGNAMKVKLLRVSSEPCTPPLSFEASMEDVKWVRKMVVWPKETPMVTPPSPAALQMLLEHYDPVSTQLFGMGRFKSIRDFYEELWAEKSTLIKRDDGVVRVLEPVILKLSYRDLILLLRHEQNEDRNYPVLKNTCIGARAIKGESWRDALNRTLETELNFPPDEFMKTLQQTSFEAAEKCHKVISETTISPSYPGIVTSYKTHHVRWSVREDAVHMYRDHGLPIDYEKRKLNPYKCDFVTTKIDTTDNVRKSVLSMGSDQTEFSDYSALFAIGTRKQLFWNWVPEHEANRLQRFLNMGEENADEKWAKYAFQKEGMVAPPPTEQALKLLLTRCGIPVMKFGTGTNKSLVQFWLELLNQDSNLMMGYGSVLRVVEITIVKLRVFTATGQPLLLVQTREVTAEGKVKNGKKIPGTRKKKHETWQESAYRCMAEDLNLHRNYVKSLFPHRNNDNWAYTFYEDQTESAQYPGVQTLYRKHLATYTLKLDHMLNTVAGRTILGNESNESEEKDGSSPKRRRSFKEAAKRSGSVRLSTFRQNRGSKASVDDGMGDMSSRVSANAEDLLEHGRKYIARPTTAMGSKTIEYEWLDEAQVQKEITGLNVKSSPVGSLDEAHSLSSVLIGLEGSAPNCTSAWGNEHSAVGAVSKISACGNHKWKCFRLNNAMQIPASTGGMRMKINRRIFQEFMETCNKLDLIDCSSDLTLATGRGCTRDLLNRRFFEKELFKQILGGSAISARRALDRFLEMSKHTRAL